MNELLKTVLTNEENRNAGELLLQAAGREDPAYDPWFDVSSQT